MAQNARHTELRNLIICSLIVACLPLVWFWPRLVNPSFSLIDDIYDIQQFRSMAHDFTSWWNEKGFHGELENGRLRPIFWLARFALYYLPLGENALSWNFMHYALFALTLVLTFLTINRVTRSAVSGIIGCSLWALSVSTIESYLRFGNQELLQMLWMSILFFLAVQYQPNQSSRQGLLFSSQALLLLFLLYFTKETSVVLLPFAIIFWLISLQQGKWKKMSFWFLLMNIVFFVLQRFLSPTEAGYSKNFQLSWDVVMSNVTLYFFALQWHYILILCLMLLIYRLFRTKFRLSEIDVVSVSFLMLGCGFFAIILPWPLNERRYLLIADYAFAVFIAIELHTFLRNAKFSRLFIALALVLGYFSLGFLPYKLKTVYSHAGQKTHVQALEWLSKKLPANAEILLLEFDQELIYASSDYLSFFANRPDIKLISLSDHAAHYQKMGRNVLYINNPPDGLLNRLSGIEAIVWYRHGTLRLKADEIHNNILSLIKRSPVGPSLSVVFSDLRQDINSLMNGVEIWRINR